MNGQRRGGVWHGMGALLTVRPHHDRTLPQTFPLTDPAIRGDYSRRPEPASLPDRTAIPLSTPAIAVGLPSTCVFETASSILRSHPDSIRPRVIPCCGRSAFRSRSSVVAVILRFL